MVMEIIHDKPNAIADSISGKGYYENPDIPSKKGKGWSFGRAEGAGEVEGMNFPNVIKDGLKKGTSASIISTNYEL